MLDIDKNNATYMHISQYFSFPWCDVWDIAGNRATFQARNINGRRWVHMEGLLTEREVRGWLAAVRARVESYIISVCPAIKNTTIDKWVNQDVATILEPFNWMTWGDF